MSQVEGLPGYEGSKVGWKSPGTERVPGKGFTCGRRVVSQGGVTLDRRVLGKVGITRAGGSHGRGGAR